MAIQEEKVQLTINRLSKQKYNELVSQSLINENELYLVNELNLDAGSEKILNVANPELSSDGANKQYVDNSLSSKVSITDSLSSLDTDASYDEIIEKVNAIINILKGNS